MWITNGAEAGIYLLFANADPSKGYRGITGFVVERDFPGFSVGKKEDKLGIRASSTCELILEDVRVPRANVVGEVGQGYKVAMKRLTKDASGSVRWSQSGQGALGQRSPTRRNGNNLDDDFRFKAFNSNSRRWRPKSRPRVMVYNTARLKESGASALCVNLL